MLGVCFRKSQTFLCSSGVEKAQGDRGEEHASGGNSREREREREWAEGQERGREMERNRKGTLPNMMSV